MRLDIYQLKAKNSTESELYIRAHHLQVFTGFWSVMQLNFILSVTFIDPLDQ